MLNSFFIFKNKALQEIEVLFLNRNSNLLLNKGKLSFKDIRKIK